MFLNLSDTEVSDCGKYLLVTMYEGLRKNLLHIANLEKIGEISDKIPLTPIIAEFNADYEVFLTPFLFQASNLMLFLHLKFSISRTLAQKWFSVRIKMHQTFV